METNPTRCDDFAAWIVEVVDGTASVEISERVALHAAICPQCASDLAFARSMRSCWPTPDRVVVPEALTDRIASTTWARRPWWRSLRVVRPVFAASALAGVLWFGIVQMNTRNINPQFAETRVASAGQSVGPVQRDVTREGAVSKTEPVDPSRSMAKGVAAGPARSPKSNGVALPVRRMSPEGRRESMTWHKMVQRAEGAGVSDSAVLARRQESVVLQTETDRRTSVSAAVLETVEPRSNSQRVSLAETPGVSAPVLSETARVVTMPSSSLSNVSVASIEDDSDRASYQDELTAQSEASRRSSGGGTVVAPDVNRVAVVQAPVATGKR